MRPSTPLALACTLTFVAAAPDLQAQVLSQVEVHADNESQEATGSPIVETHLDNNSTLSNGLAITPDGKFLIMSSLLDDAVTVFSRDPETGALTLVEVHEDNGSPEANGSPVEETHINGAMGVAVTPDGRHVLVASNQDDALTVFSRDGSSGVLTLVEVHADNESPEANGGAIVETHLEESDDLAVSPDGKNVYLVSPRDSAVTVFSRNAETGALTLLEIHDDNESPEANGSPIEETHLNGASHVAVSPDGANVYVTANTDDAVTVFARNSGTGALTLVEIHDDDGSPEVNGSPIEETHFDGASQVAISPDGGFAYVTSPFDFGLTVFARDSGTGALTLVEVHADNESPETDGSPTAETHLETPYDLAVSDTYLLVASTRDFAATLFARDTTTGALTLVEIHADNESPELDGTPLEETHLETTSNIQISPDGRSVYVASNQDDGLTCLAASPPVSTGIFADGFELGDSSAWSAAVPAG